MRYKWIIAGVFIFIVCLSFYFFKSKIDNNLKLSNKNKTIKVKSIKKEKNFIVLNGVEFYNSKKGEVEWQLESDKAIINKDKNIAYLDNVTFHFKKENILLFSDKGIYNLKTKDANVFKNVKLKGDSWEIFTDNLTFFRENGKVISNSPFKFVGKDFFLKGKTLIGFIDKKRFIIKGRVESKWLRR